MTSNYSEEIAHGKIYTAPFSRMKEVRKLGGDYHFVAPYKDDSWKREIPPNSRLVKIENFDIRPELAPSKRLLSGLKRKLLSPTEFDITYSLEMEDQRCQDSIKELAILSLNGTKVVIFGLPQPNETCHRQMLAKLVARAVVENSTSRHRAKIKAYSGELSL